MLTIGCHLSSSRGYLAMGKEAVKINANTFSFLPGIRAVPKPKTSIQKMLLNFFHLQKNMGLKKFSPMLLTP